MSFPPTPATPTHHSDLNSKESKTLDHIPTVQEEAREEHEQGALHPVASSDRRASSTTTLNQETVVTHGMEHRGVTKTSKGDKTIVEFEPEEGPKQWKNPYRWYCTFTATSLALVVSLGSSMPTGDLPGTAETLHVSNEVINLTVSLYVAGFGIGPLLCAPMSEVYGRRPVYIVSMFIFFIFTLPCALAPNIATILAGRMIAGLAASAPFCNVGGTVADLWATHERGIPMAAYSSTLFLGPCLGPLFGGWIGQKTGHWRWIYWVLFCFCFAAFILAFFTPETLEIVLLRKKAHRLNKQHKTDMYISKADLDRVPFRETMKIALLRPFILMSESIIVLFSFYLSFIYALLYATFFAFPIAFEEKRGWSAGMTGVAFLSICIGIFLANLVNWWQETLYARHAVKHGPVPEGRLYPMMIGAVTLPIALLILAFTSYPGMTWVGPAAAGVVFGFSMVTIYVAGNSYIVDSYSHVAASAISSKNLMRCLIAASVPLWINQLLHNLKFQFGCLLLAGIAVVIAPMPFYFFFRGDRVRTRAKRALKVEKKDVKVEGEGAV
ncbi:hypothetical protein B9479_004239 [Cryptococcus floricola]|uniref:Major facilitator superfamily (MFS) profile domain-containing protein n=1 Tax=Cryptococcus floricola TaxID=2591691 RepID=A0A5D3AXZ8_9TREE|nr:hypothetical protein B9479_004239 [Cryptococcus floricola]